VHAQIPKVRSPVLLIALITLLLAGPMIAEEASIIVGILFALVLAAAIYTVSTSWHGFVFAIILGVPAILSTMLPLPEGTDLLKFAIRIAFFLYIEAHYLHYLVKPGRVDLERLAAAACCYMLLGLVFSTMYQMLLLFDPSAFSGIATGTHDAGDLLHFSYVTLTTVGYGDITPRHPFARSLAALEAMCGTFYISILVARLVSLYGSELEHAFPRGRAHAARDPETRPGTPRDE